MGDSYRPGRPDRDRPPPLTDRMTFTSGGGDAYRPNGGSANRSEFTFESSHAAPRFAPTGPSDPGPRAHRRRGRGGEFPRDSRRGDNYGSHYGRNNANGSRRGRGGYKKAAPHERALLQHRDGASPERTLGVIDGENKFLNIDDLSDDEEADMDESTDEDNANGQASTRKAARTEAPRADGDSVPKWSNPDPYTALPPPCETTGVKRDVVQLIRKAKNQAAEKAVGNSAVADNDDFISFGDDDAFGDAPGLKIYEEEEPLPKRPRRGFSPQSVQSSVDDHASVSDFAPRENDRPRDFERPRDYDRPLPPPSRGNKRKHGDEVALIDVWAPRRNTNRTPWVQPGQYAHLAGDPEKWLHNEILDFYDFVAPQPFEHDARHKLMQRVTTALAARRWFPHDAGRIYSFGSFPAGLYLPTADMDLVYASDRHFNGGPPVIDAARKGGLKNTLYKVSRRLEEAQIPAGRPLVIAMAKVPIVKFKDRLTNIDVDISFENLSGVQAQATFNKWKRDYPDMVFMVALVKQFLAMRGLNEVHTGGLGGFSVICLIVSYIQHIPKPENLGECFIGFLQYYGKTFDVARKRIQMHPPAVVNKTMYGIDGREEKADGLSIQDPNRPENNISGGSHKAKLVLKAFGAAYETIADRMAAARTGQDIGQSILGCILGANYDTYLDQRRLLKDLK